MTGVQTCALPISWFLVVRIIFPFNLHYANWPSSSATNVVAVGAAAKAGCKIDFVKFLKFGGMIAFETLVIASIYLFVRYM